MSSDEEYDSDNFDDLEDSPSESESENTSSEDEDENSSSDDESLLDTRGWKKVGSDLPSPPPPFTLI